MKNKRIPLLEKIGIWYACNECHTWVRYSIGFYDAIAELIESGNLTDQGELLCNDCKLFLTRKGK